MEVQSSSSKQDEEASTVSNVGAVRCRRLRMGEPVRLVLPSVTDVNHKQYPGPEGPRLVQWYRVTQPRFSDFTPGAHLHRIPKVGTSLSLAAFSLSRP